MRQITKLLVSASLATAAAGYAGSAAAGIYVGVAVPAVTFDLPFVRVQPAPVYPAPVGYYPRPVGYCPDAAYGDGWSRRWHEWHEREEWRERQAWRERHEREEWREHHEHEGRRW